MTLVRIIKDWDWPDLLRQTPASSGRWDGVQFTLEAVPECDYVVVLNKVPVETTVDCPARHVWALIQEPPNEYSAPLTRGIGAYERIYTMDTAVSGRRYRRSQPALPWHVDRDYDTLVSCDVPEKPRGLSWVTSNRDAWPGHRKRLAFLERIRNRIDFDLFGRGFDPIEDKWGGVAPYRYSIVVENTLNPYYWTEKLSDCFLSWTLPIYCGCPRVADYFPGQAVACIDIEDPGAPEEIRRIVSSDRWERSLAALGEARQRMLNEHQLFPFLVREIRQHEPCDHQTRCRVRLSVPGDAQAPENNQALVQRLARKVKNLFN